MKTSIKYLASAALAMFVFFSANSTYAQRGGRGGGGGGSHGGGGGGFHSGGGGGFGGHSGGSVGHSGGSFNGGNRGSFQGGQRQPQVNNSPRVSQQAPQSINRDSRAYSSQSYRGQQRVYSNSARGGVYSRGRNFTGRTGVYYHGGYRSTYRNFNGGYYNRFYAPHIGFRLSVLPYGYYPFYWGDDQFYYNNGLFYQQYDNGSDYQVVAPPMDAIVPTVPEDAKSITIDGIQYYESNGVYYQPVTTSDGTTGYKIVGKDGELNTDQGNGDVYPQDDNNSNNNQQN
jgi:hypothetical protein